MDSLKKFISHNRILNMLKGFFFPPAGVPLWVRILPYAVLGILTIVVLVAGTYAWDYTNSPAFCGTTCHTMPPEYQAYNVSPHARVDCVECHIGKSFLATRITRKAGDISHIIDLVFSNYEYPIYATKMRPARDTCELCHFPEKFSDDKFREIKQHQNDEANTAVSTYIYLKTGGGSHREGLGKGIHWHIENPVYYLPTDALEQTIPYVREVDEKGNAQGYYVDVVSGVKSDTIKDENLKKMDCITCHNRISHLVPQPEEAADQLINRGVISQKIPEARIKMVEVLRAKYDSSEQALKAIGELDKYYQEKYPDFYTENSQLVTDMISAVKGTYNQSIFPSQKIAWETHPTNIGHNYFPGCMRCHDGKHLNSKGEAIPLECNLCHSIPVVVGPDKFVANIEISRGPEPESHKNSNWINLHRSAFNLTCSTCHTMKDAGGTSNTSFCSNSACHGTVWKYAGYDAPGLREIIQKQLKEVAPPPEPTTPASAPSAGGEATAALTYTDKVGAIFQQNCGNCHGGQGTTMKGLNLTTYKTLMAGGENGAVIQSGDADNSLLIKTIGGAQPHFAQLSAEDLDLVKKWIAAGAPEGTPSVQETPTPGTGEINQAKSWDGGIQTMLASRCVMCHAEGGMGAEKVIFTGYQDAIKGGEEGGVIVPGNSKESELVQVQLKGGHPGQLTKEELDQIIAWIDAGAIEK